MTYVAQDPSKFLSRQLRSNLSEDAAKAKILAIFEEYTRKIDALPLPGVHKIWIFDAVSMSKISWDFTIHDIRVSFATPLGALQEVGPIC